MLLPFTKVQGGGGDISSEISREVIRKAISDRNRPTLPEDSWKEDLDVGQVGKLRGLCPIEAALGITEINENLAKAFPKPYYPHYLIIPAREKELCSATRLILTAWSPNSYLHRLSGCDTNSKYIGSSIP
jgi:hypothetical protein